MQNEIEISITSPHFPATKFVIERTSKSGYGSEYYNVDRNDWSQTGTLWSYRSHAEVVLNALHKAIEKTGKPSLDQNVCPCSGCHKEKRRKGN
jgi:hypothetical protein